MSKDEFDSALEKYKEAKALYEETGIATKVDDMNNKIITVAETIQKIQKDTERADQEFQNGNQYMDGGDYARALEKITVAKTLYTNLFNLTKSNESYRGLYESKITECEEKIQNLQEKIDEDKEKNVELPKIQAVFVVAIALLLASLVFGIILIRKE